MTQLQLGAILGSGAYGTVYKATWGGRQVAVKKFHINEAESSQGHVQREIQLLRTLQDRHIIQFYGTSFHEGRLVVITEYAEKGSLRHAIESTLIEDWSTKERIAREIARGLAYIHSMKVLHLDLKSDNVLLTNHLEVRLCDFGLSAIKTTSSASRLTESLKGTVRWMAPELFTKRPEYTTKSDVYALGMVMWEMAANKTRPFAEHRNNAMVVLLVERGEREDLPNDTPTEYRRWVERCWRQNPQERPEAIELALSENEGPTDPEIVETTITGDGSMVSLTDDGARWMATSPVSSPSTETASLWSRNRSMSVASSIISSTSPVRPEFRMRLAEEPFAMLLLDAEYGNVDAQLALAERYQNGGGGIEVSESQAFFWYLRAARQEHPQAQYLVAQSYRLGKGTAQSDNEAVSWYKKAAKQGHAEARKALGDMYLEGIGVAQDYNAAVKLYRSAIERGHAGAKQRLGWMYQNGKGVEQDDVTAAMWYRTGANQGDAESQRCLGSMLLEGQGGKQSDINAKYWFKKAAEQGLVEAQHQLGVMLRDGRGDKQSDAEAGYWFHKAAIQGNADAQLNFGILCLEGRGIDKNELDAITWFTKAAAQGNIEAQRILGQLFLESRGETGRHEDRTKVVAQQAPAEADRINQTSVGRPHEQGVPQNSALTEVHHERRPSTPSSMRSYDSRRIPRKKSIFDIFKRST
ncbi:hypothetical protein BGW41_007870 [Actinomortierella wolfii]|nr:hypothetical protein BGW41_007870 [Actinomortierella wolfii]